MALAQGATSTRGSQRQKGLNRSGAGDLTSRNPITGIAGCCACAASGHAAAPLNSAMKSRLFTA